MHSLSIYITNTHISQYTLETKVKRGVRVNCQEQSECTEGMFTEKTEAVCHLFISYRFLRGIIRDCETFIYSVNVPLLRECIFQFACHSGKVESSLICFPDPDS